MKKIIILCVLVSGLLFNAKAQQVNKYEVELTEMNEKLALNITPEQKVKYMQIVNDRTAFWKSLSMEAKEKGEDFSSSFYRDKANEYNKEANQKIRSNFTPEQRKKYNAYILEIAAAAKAKKNS
jgi:hypothetical protein